MEISDYGAKEAEDYFDRLWEEAVKMGKIRSDEFRVIPDKSRGIGNFTTNEIMKYTRKANFLFFMNPHRWLRTLNYAIKNADYRTFNQGVKMFKGIVTKRFSENIDKPIYETITINTNRDSGK